jgi:hypothetical protein
MVSVTAWPTAIEAYRLLLRHWSPLTRLAAGWMACFLGLDVARMVAWSATMSTLLAVLTAAAIAAGAAAFSVGCYRAMLLDETDIYLIRLNLGWRELHYLVHQSAIALILGGPLALWFMLVAADGWWAAAFATVRGGAFDALALLRVGLGSGLLLPLVAMGFLAAARLLLALPAVAIDEPERLLGDAWRHSRSNATALFRGWMACILPVTVAWTALAFLAKWTFGAVAAPLLEFLAYPALFVALALTAGFYAYVYAQLVEGEEVRTESRLAQVLG